MVLEAADRGASVTRRLLAFARRDSLQAAPVDVARLLADLREVLVHTLGAMIKVRVDTPDELPLVLADRSQLETVLVNLATNARDAMLPAGGTLVLTAAVEDVVDTLTHPMSLAAGAYLRIEVADAGTGMDADTLAHATEPFFTTKPQGKGTGLGLSMARGFATQSGGGLRVESEQDKGTIVTLWLPLACGELEHPGAVVENPSPAPDLASSEPRIEAKLLLVDDDPLVRLTLAAELRERGYAVAEAEGGTAALARLDAGERVDLLVTDLSMPDMTGAALIYEAQGRRPGLPAVLVTGYAGAGATLAIGDAAPDATFALLRKPASATELADLVAALLYRRSQAGGLTAEAPRQG